MDTPPLRSRVSALVQAGVTRPAPPRAAWLRRGRVDLVFLGDVVLALICFAATDNALGHAAAQAHSALNSIEVLLISFVLCAPLVLRTRLPLTAWTASAIAMIWAGLVVQPHTPSTGAYVVGGGIVYILCLYAVAARCEIWVVITAGVVTVAGAGAINSAVTVTAVFVAAATVLAGLIVRSRRGSREQLAVAERRHEGERALLEERQRIARELHDVVAHHMSVIAIQAEAAPYKTADPPPELVESFADIRSSALSGLSELRRVLGVLRSDKPDTTPQPGLDDLDGLLESARNAGLTVGSGVNGVPRPLPDGVDLSGYRIVQEALSNAMRHAPGSTVQVDLFYGEAALVIEVRNDGVPAGGQDTPDQPDGAALEHSGGHGIIGMRERAAMLGGHLRAGPTGDGGFLVTAALPLGDREPEDTS
jgi:signal transduction histidine kinase